MNAYANENTQCVISVGNSAARRRPSASGVDSVLFYESSLAAVVFLGICLFLAEHFEVALSWLYIVVYHTFLRCVGDFVSLVVSSLSAYCLFVAFLCFLYTARCAVPLSYACNSRRLTPKHRLFTTSYIQGVAS